jgi:hypothetical protein
MAGLSACAAPATNPIPAHTAAIPVPYTPVPQPKPILEEGEMIYRVFDYKITPNAHWATQLSEPGILAELLSDEYSYNFLKRQILPLPKDMSADDRCENFKVQPEDTSLQQYLSRYGLNVADLQLNPLYSTPEPVTGKPGARPEPVLQNRLMVQDGRFSQSALSYDFSRGVVRFNDQPVQVFRTDCSLKQFREMVIVPQMTTEQGTNAAPILLTHIDGVFFYSIQP